MAQFTAEQVERTLDACLAHVAEIAETFRASLGCDLRVIAAEPRPYGADVLLPFAGPGLAVSLVLGEQGVLLLIPEPIPLPSWYREPGISENNRLQTFAHELSLRLLPADLQADRYFATFAPSLKEFAERGSGDPAMMVLSLPVFETAMPDSDPPLADILVMIPANVSPAVIEDAAESAGKFDATEPAETEMLDGISVSTLDAGEENPESRAPVEAPASTGMTLDQALRALRILNVPVTVSVRLAERKMPLGQIVALVPGSLVPFNKSCEDLLDLFVNNYRYCKGEAIKIGENFGIKVAKVGVTEERKEHVL